MPPVPELLADADPLTDMLDMLDMDPVAEADADDPEAVPVTMPPTDDAAELRRELTWPPMALDAAPSTLERMF